MRDATQDKRYINLKETRIKNQDKRKHAWLHGCMSEQSAKRRIQEIRGKEESNR
jgi:hypothetical protein